MHVIVTSTLLMIRSHQLRHDLLTRVGKVQGPQSTRGPKHVVKIFILVRCTPRTSSRELEATTGAAAYNLDEEHP